MESCHDGGSTPWTNYPARRIATQLALSRSLVFVPLQLPTPVGWFCGLCAVRDGQCSDLQAGRVVTTPNDCARSAQRTHFLRTCGRPRCPGTRRPAASCGGSYCCLTGECDIHGIGHLGPCHGQIRDCDHELARGSRRERVGRSYFSRWVPLARHCDEARQRLGLGGNRNLASCWPARSVFQRPLPSAAIR